MTGRDSPNSAGAATSASSRSFGSVLRDDFGPQGDVDVLYEFEEGHVPGWEIVDIEEELSNILGRKIDFVPAKYLNRF